MQRFSFMVLLLAVLYVSTGANATQDPHFASAPAAALSMLAVPVTPVTQSAQALPVADNPAPHIALLLPLKSKSSALARAAEVVRQGFAAAALVQRGLPVRVYASTDEAKEVVSLYRQAVANGAIAIVGPLTHDGVAALANYSGVTIPTIALNSVELSRNSGKLYFFGLPVENEAREVAELAANSRLHSATIISTGSPISKRLAAAFADEWKRLGGMVTAEVKFGDDYAELDDLPVAPWPAGSVAKDSANATGVTESQHSNRQQDSSIAPGNMVFLAAEHEKARLIRPYLNSSLPVYATSQVFKGNANTLANFDLNEIHFVDMPWLLQADHPAVMMYPRSAALLEPEVDRLYAMGIDAYRLSNALQVNRVDTLLPLDGVTGKIKLVGQQFLREPVPAFFRYGLGLTPGTLAALNAAKAAAKAAARQAENPSSAPLSTQ